MKQQPTSKREQLLHAANHIVLEKGAAHLTLDAVAAQSGVSKGGLLYHFPSKEALVKGMIDHYLATFAVRLDQVYDRLPDAPGRWLRAFVIASFEDDPRNPALLSAAVAAIVNQPELLKPLHAQYAQWMAAATADGTSQAVAQVVIAATDGVWFGKVFTLPTVLADVRESLMKLIESGTLA